MFGFVKNIAKTAFNVGGMMLGNLTGAVMNVGIKPIRAFIDSLRPKVVPVAGSVVYCDLWVVAEHSGVYVGDDLISNIVVTGFADSEVKLDNPQEFTSKAITSKKIYVSCNGLFQAVGNQAVADYADTQVGERSFYGLVFKNCHMFCAKCVNQSDDNPSFLTKVWRYIEPDLPTEWEFTINLLKKTARHKLGATKWLLWDWQNDNQTESEPDWEAQNDFFKKYPMTPEFIKALKHEMAETKEYMDEISDEPIPTHITNKLKTFNKTLDEVHETYEKHRSFLEMNYGQYSYDDLKNSNLDFSALAKELQNNPKIKELAHKMGRAYVSETRQKRTKVPTRSKSEVHGTHYSDDIMRLLPSELVNIDDETLQHLFYARLHEKTLTTYELDGISMSEQEAPENRQKRTGSVVACLDTSASMQGEPLLKAKASLFAIANILKREKRDLYVLLFGDTGQIKEYRLESSDDLAGLLKFLQKGFDGGTDFESPLTRAVEIIESQNNYIKADILMLSDGDCELSNSFIKMLNDKKAKLDLMVYSVLCHGDYVKDKFSDEVLIL